MRKFFKGIVERYTKWRQEQIRRRLEQDLKVILLQMDAATREIHWHRYDTMYHGRKKFLEAVAVIEVGNTTLKEMLPFCNADFQEEAWARHRTIARLLEAEL